MTVLTEGMHPAEFIVAELPHLMSRDVGVLASGNDLDAGAVLGKVTADGKYAALAPAASDGTEAAVAILLAPVDATDADQPCVVVYWAADVNAGEIVWPDGITDPQKTAAIAQLAALHLRVQ